MNIQNNYRILLVEDDATCRYAACFLLKNWTNKLDIAICGKEAVTLGKSQKYDLILTDIGLPDYDGCEVAKQIRKYHNNKKTPIIAITSHAANGEYKNKCLSSGINQVFEKPLDSEKLKIIINKHLNTIENDSSWVSDEQSIKNNQNDDALASLDINKVVNLMKIKYSEAEKLQNLFIIDLQVKYEALLALKHDIYQEEVQSIIHQILGSSHFGGAMKLKNISKQLNKLLNEIMRGCLLEEKDNCNALFNSLIEEICKVLLLYKEQQEKKSKKL